MFSLQPAIRRSPGNGSRSIKFLWIPVFTGMTNSYRSADHAAREAGYRSPLTAYASAATRPEAMPYQQHRPDRDRGVGDVKRRPMIAQHMKIEEVEHGPEVQAIDEIADRATKDEAQRSAEERFSGMPPQQIDDPNGGDDCNRDEKETPQKLCAQA